MAGSKRKGDDGTGSEAPKRKKKKLVPEEVDGEVKRDRALTLGLGNGVGTVGGTSTASPVKIHEALEEGDGAFEKGKGKKSGKERGQGKKGLDNFDSRPMSDSEPHRKKKEKKKLKEKEEEEEEEEKKREREEEEKREKEKKGKGKEDTSLPSGLDGLQSVDDHGLVSSAEPQRKRKKKKEIISRPSSPVTAQIVENHGLLSGAEPQRKKKKTKEVISVLVTVDSSQIAEDGQGKKGKKTKKGAIPAPNTSDLPQIVEDGQGKKEKTNEGVIPVPNTLDLSQIAEDGQGKKKKKTKKVIPVPHASDLPQIVEDGQGKKEKMNEGVIPVPNTLDLSQIAEDGQGKKKKKTKKGAIPAPNTSDSPQIVEDGQGKKKKKAKKGAIPVPNTSDLPQIVEDGQGKKKKKTKKEVTPVSHPSDLPQIVEDGLGSGAESHGKKKKKKKKKKKGEFAAMLSSPDPSQAAEDCGPATRSAKNTILKSQRPQAGNGAESNGKKGKKVTFQLPERVEDEPSENEPLGTETDFCTDLEFNTWTTDKLRPGLSYGLYTAEEDGLLKQAIFDYIQEHGWDQEEGLEKIMNSRGSEARGCWHVIRKCLPQRELKRLYARAHRILGPNVLLGKWSNEEMEALTQLQSVHGNDWKRISTVIGRDAEACRDKWRCLKVSNSKDYRTGAWSEEEQEKLCELVMKCLHVKAQMAKKGLINKGHRLIRDDINWDFIAEQMGGRNRLNCMNQWYKKMASPMVTTGEWSNGDDQRLLARLTEEFPLSEELVEWDSLLNNRSGETCKKRWEQMQRTLGRGPEVRHQHFLEKLESITKRFAPHLLDPEYDQKFAEDMERADADEPAESEDLDV